MRWAVTSSSVSPQTSRPYTSRPIRAADLRVCRPLCCASVAWLWMTDCKINRMTGQPPATRRPKRPLKQDVRVHRGHFPRGPRTANVIGGAAPATVGGSHERDPDRSPIKKQNPPALRTSALSRDDHDRLRSRRRYPGASAEGRDRVRLFSDSACAQRHSPGVPTAQAAGSSSARRARPDHSGLCG